MGNTQKLDAGYSYSSPFLSLSLSFPFLFFYLSESGCVVVSHFLGFPTNFVGEGDAISLACTPTSGLCRDGERSWFYAW